jgi:hypothetical protein
MEKQLTSTLQDLAKVSLIGFVLATRAPVQLLEDTIPIPLNSTAFLGLKFKSVK